MEDNDFDRHYADKMQQVNAPDFSQEDWERLSPRLDAFKKRKKLIISPILLFLLGGLLLGSNIAWWTIWRQSEQKTANQISGVQPNEQQNFVLQDTTWNKVVIYQYDTVRQTIILPTYSPGVALAQPVSAGTDLSNRLKGKNMPPAGKGHENEISQVPEGLISKEDTPSSENSSDIYVTATKTGITDHLPVRSLLLIKPGKYVSMAAYDLFIMPFKPVARPYQPTPMQVRIGPGGGLVLPVADDFSSSSGFSMGLASEIAFSDRLAFTLEGDYIGVTFKGTEYDEGWGLPALLSPGDDYNFKYFETHDGYKPILQLTAGVKYWFAPSRKISPYAGLGYVSQWHRPFELEAEYVNINTGLELSNKIEVQALDNPVSLLNINAGLRYRLSAHWLWQTGAGFQFKIDHKQAGLPRYWGLKSVILYEF